MTVIGIDPGTRCGWAVLDDEGRRIGSGVWNLQPSRHAGGGMRYLRFRRYLDELLTTAGPGAVVAYELVRRHAGTDAAHVYGGIVAALGMLCEERGVPYQGVPVATVKATATGKGNASKDAMVAAAASRWLHTVEADDEADALWIAETQRQEVAA